jgi:hypothetical protein
MFDSELVLPKVAAMGIMSDMFSEICPSTMVRVIAFRSGPQILDDFRETVASHSRIASGVDIRPEILRLYRRRNPNGQVR